MIRDILKRYLDNNMNLAIFGLVWLSSVRSVLRHEGVKRIPNQERLKRIIRDLYDHKITNGVSFGD